MADILTNNCKICGKPEQEKYKPFCSKRCADVDLGRWLKGGYAIAGQDGEAGFFANDNPDEDPQLK